MPCNDEALERRGRDASVRAGRELVDPGDVAVWLEPAQLALEPVHQIEGRLRGLCCISFVGVDGEHLVDRRHRLVREAPDVMLLTWPFDSEAALRVGGELHRERLQATGFGLQGRHAPCSQPCMSRDHRQLKVFHLAHELVCSIYRETSGFPVAERYGLQSQL